MSENRKHFLLRALDPSFLLGMLCTLAFYAVVHQPSMRETLLYRYTTEHIVEYVIVALFIWGIADIVLKFFSFPREVLALRVDWLPPRQGREPAANARTLLEQVRNHKPWLLSSKVGKRLAMALEYVIEKGSPDEYREHLHYLSDQDEDHTHAKYMLTRFIIAVTPVLGFLGTVVHFGTALSGFSFDEMADRLPVIVGEMGAAFNTTTVALAAAMSMMFSLFVCERVERGIVRSTDRLVERELLHRFEAKDPNIVPFLSILQSANNEALQAIDATLQRQIETWTQALGGLFQRFDERQQQELHGWHAALDVLQQRHETYDAAREERLRQLLANIETKQDRHLAHIQAVLERAVTLKDNFGGLVETLRTIAHGEGKLVDLQTALSDNLRVLRETQQIDEALHGLTAAIHLITARHRQPDFPGSAAA